MLTKYSTALRERLHREPALYSPAGTPLPPHALRMGGAHYQDDAEFVSSARRDVRRLVDLAGLTTQSRLVDWGCGAGRLAVGVIEELGGIRQYLGIDVQAPLVRWAQRHLARPGMTFVHVDAGNARYNPDGREQAGIPVADAQWDVLYAFSVLSHMTSDDTRRYLAEMARLLRPGGRAFLTAFVEPDVPDEQENPDGYGPFTWQGRLHCVRYERGYFEGMVRAAGLEVAHVQHGQEADGQSLYVLAR